LYFITITFINNKITFTLSL